jgi:hypothetical protein
MFLWTKHIKHMLFSRNKWSKNILASSYINHDNEVYLTYQTFYNTLIQTNKQTHIYLTQTQRQHILQAVFYRCMQVKNIKNVLLRTNIVLKSLTRANIAIIASSITNIAAMSCTITNIDVTIT